MATQKLQLAPQAKAAMGGDVMNDKAVVQILLPPEQALAHLQEHGQAESLPLSSVF